MKEVRRHHDYFYYGDKSVGYSFWSNTVDNQKPDVVIFLGAGQTGAIVRMAAQRAGAGVVVIGGVPHWHAKPGTDIEDFTKLYFENAYQKILSTYKTTKMHVLAESQAAPAAIFLISRLKETGNLGLIHPLGFSVQAFGSTAEARLKTFRRRILRTLFQYPQSFLYDPRNFLISLILFRAMLREASLASLNEKYAIGISYDSTKDLQEAIQVTRKRGNTISFILGEKDKMFPPKEILKSLGLFDISHVNINIIPSVSHSSLATRGSKKVLTTALQAVRKNKHSRA